MPLSVPTGADAGSEIAEPKARFARALAKAREELIAETRRGHGGHSPLRGSRDGLTI